MPTGTHITGTRIKERRNELDMSQEKLAELLGTNQQQIWRYESGRNEPTAPVLAEIARALNTSTDWLVGLTKIKERPLRNEADLTEIEREAVRLIRLRNPDEQKRIVEIIRLVR